MAKLHNIFKKRSTMVVMALFVVTAVGLFFWDHNRVWERSRKPDGVWTVTMADETTPYTLRAPLAMFRIHLTQITSRRELTANMTTAHALSMEWHYESGEPWVLWAMENQKNSSVKDKVKLYATIDIVSADSNTAARAESVYLDNEINNPNPALNAKAMGKVWNNTVSKFEHSYATYYLIEEREPYDGRVITCRQGASYCSLRGARVTDTLRLRYVLIWKEDVMNWKQYQDKARSLIQQAIVVDQASSR